MKVYSNSNFVGGFCYKGSASCRRTRRGLRAAYITPEHMDSINNNLFEVKPSPRKKRKISTPCPSAYMNPALDLLATEDPICNTVMEIMPNKKRKRTKSCGETSTFDNTAMDLGVSKVAMSEFLVKELDNVRNNLKKIEEVQPEPEYSNLEEIKALDLTKKAVDNLDITDLPISTGMDFNNVSHNVEPTNIMETTNNISELDFASITHGDTTPKPLNQIFINNQTNLSLSFIDRLTLTSPTVSNQSLYLDDDLNESNIMEIKTITIITKKKNPGSKPKSTNPFLNSSDEITYVDDVLMEENPFLNIPKIKSLSEPVPSIKDDNEVSEAEPVIDPLPNYRLDQPSTMVPRRLFTNDTNSTVSTVNDLSLTNVESQNEYENIDSLRSESPVYANIDEVYFAQENYNKQSKILGQDVSQFGSRDILNLNTRNAPLEASYLSVNSNEMSDSKKNHDFTHQINKLSKKVFQKLKKTFKSDKHDPNVTLNPYEVPRKVPKTKPAEKEICFENPALNLDNSDEIEEIEDDEHVYETVKTARNTRLNMNLTPLRECNREQESFPLNTTNTPGRKQVRFDSTLNQEKVITGNSFDGDIKSPGLDSKIDNFHDELENCINEKKFIAFNM